MYFKKLEDGVEFVADPFIVGCEPDDPRTLDNVTTMICKHGKYDLGDLKPSSEVPWDQFKDWNDVKKYIEEKYKPLIIRPLYLYDHSGLTIATSPFACRWDNVQVGFVFITKERLDEMGIEDRSHENLERILDAEVREYDAYISGDVWVKVIVVYEDESKSSVVTDYTMLYSPSRDEINGFQKIYDTVDIYPNVVVIDGDKIMRDWTFAPHVIPKRDVSHVDKYVYIKEKDLLIRA